MKGISLKAMVAAIICILLISSVYAEPGSAARFKDIKATDWFAEAVGKMNGLKIINGMPDGSFNPQGQVTRAQFVKMLVQAMEYKKTDSVSFNDLRPFPTSKPYWASVYIETALRNGVIAKDEIGENFFPDVPLTRRDMGIMMFRALKLQPSTGENPFADITESNGSLTKLYEEYLIRGSIEGGKVLYKPEGLTTRAEAAVIIARLVGYKENPQAFKSIMAMEERFANGTPTAEDISLKRQIEIAKAKADPSYIMEPIITIERNEDYKNYRWFELYFENETDYSDDAKWELECVNYKQLNNYEMPRPDGTFIKKTIMGWRPLGSKYKDLPRTASYILGKNYYTTQALIKDFKLYSGMQLKYKITVKKGLKERVLHKTVKLQ